MFGHSFIINNPPKSPASASKPSKMQSPVPARRNIPATPRCVTPASTSPHPVSKPNRDTEMSERFKNHAYNRQPSPVGRFLSPGRGRKDTLITSVNEEHSHSARERAKPTPPKSAVPYYGTVAASSDVMRRRMEEHNAERDNKRSQASPERARPKTTEYRKTERKSDNFESPCFENKVLLAVKDVLSQALIEKGKIDVNNINAIIDAMKNRLVSNETQSYDSEDETIPLDVNFKQSTTKLNIVNIPKNSTFLISKAKPLPGIIRRNIVEPIKKTQKIHKTTKHKDDSPSSLQKELIKNNNYQVFNKDYEPTVYIEIPDSDYSNFNSIVKKEAEISKSSHRKKNDLSEREKDLALNKGQQTEALENNFCLGDSKSKTVLDAGFIEGRVGDCNLGACQPHNFWKTAEDVKLQNYIESLIRNMNDQLNGKTSNPVFENQIETEHTVCKSFCVCKVCVSSKTSSKKTLKDTPSSSKVKSKSQAELKLKNSALNNSIAAANYNKPRQSKVISKDTNKESNFRILQRNANFQPESKLNLASRYAMGHEMKHGPSSSGSYLMVAPEETSEDLYLQRRVNIKAPVKRRMSTKI